MLETFIVEPVHQLKQLSFPDTIWNLQKLKYIYIKEEFYGLGGYGVGLPIENLDGDSVLYQLDTFCGAALFVGGSILEEQMRKFPNIRKLKCILWKFCDTDIDSDSDSDTKAFYNIGVPGFLRRLESLTMTWYRVPLRVPFELSFPANLKKLTLSGFQLPWSKISTIGQLPNLEVLKLLDDAFRSYKWEIEEGEFFPKLRYLKLSGLDLLRWRTVSYAYDQFPSLKKLALEMCKSASDFDHQFPSLDKFVLEMCKSTSHSDDQFPSLEKLVLEKCKNLEEMPSCLESIPTLEMIEVRDCSEATNALVKHIKEQRELKGDSALNILLN